MNDTTQVAERNQNAVAKGQEERPTPTLTLLPAVDIIEDSNGVTLWADLPGVTKDKLQVNVHDGNLHIEAEAIVPTPAGLRVQHAEIRQPHFARAFSLGADLDASKIEANLQDGVLKLTIPRRDEARPRRIAVNVA
ncbi:Hsp20/alpha crystallin family protein [Cupriavidus taiwanensis]|uniref:Heat shock chaperone, Hsp20 family n=1 Tax=Cupriavidus taiwanensis TaxID=164546 RepID=A0A375HII7_9BURK|nr:Hsp20/alpha crystallin family protein [Cupriavidus taiwanensis]SOY67146.1 putative small heat shock protein (HSP20) family protein [Cupriavidus taiwanensis]SOY67186.1 putative small heat shock protein (HSP20) family protein [Cupriavidus taiwanensis]SOY94842.1 putative small heat shock protein (HSP20) family protein [Cupriavidus taiwanensis]SOZ28181.1 putative small heat shock protein (HSP20) family protein [Cupriavidus taiwanensis]SOZ71757.1 putative small heat shock protein (HSP20) family 